MSSLFYFKLAVQNIRKNAQTYLPYILTCIGSVMMFNILLALACNPEIKNINGGSNMIQILNLGCIVIALFTSLFLLYTNSFLIKRRKMEIGLYNILGMGKKHIGIILLFETVCIAAASLFAGIGGGFLFSKAMYLLLLRLTRMQVQWGFYFSKSAAAASIALYGGVFLLILAVNLARVHVSSPIELLRGGHMGEQEPKTRWWLAIAGVVTLGAGYYLAITTRNPAVAVSNFFNASILVMVGTYCLFTAGSIALLKCLKRRKKFYYKTEHFISVSGLLYRMKQNAAGLAGICILSTSVLVMLSSTAALYVGMDDILRKRFPRDFMFHAENAAQEDVQEIVRIVQEALAKAGLAEVNELSYRDLSLLVTEGENGIFHVKPGYQAGDLDKIRSMYVMQLEDYNRLTGSQAELSDGECMVVTQKVPYQEENLSVSGITYRAVPSENYGLWEGADTFGPEVYYLIVPNFDDLQIMARIQQEQLGEFAHQIQYHYDFDLDTDETVQRGLYKEIMDGMKGISVQIAGESAADQKSSYYSLNAGLLFLGIFLGTLFVMATVLIIYYKQVTEGYDDKGRFEIMQKVGLSKREIRTSIHFQILLMFFLPLAAAALHIIVAFPVMTVLLSAMNLTNVRLYAVTTAVTLSLFTLVYAGVYALTSRVYYKIVS